MTIGSTCLGGGVGRKVLRAVTMTAQFLLTILLDFNSLLPLVVSVFTCKLVFLNAGTHQSQQAANHLALFNMMGCQYLASPRAAMQVYQAIDVDASEVELLFRLFSVRNRTV